jgi:D-erythro-7,8-dihydroneopterin triphosphate epimerase
MQSATNIRRPATERGADSWSTAAQSPGERNQRVCRPATATINVDNLRLRTYIGFNPDERAKQQDVIINIAITYALADGVFDDEVSAALNYKTITKQVISLVEEGRFLLLEKLVADILAVCCQSAAVHHSRVRVDKPHALRFADSVSLTLDYHADHSNGAQELTP